MGVSKKDWDVIGCPQNKEHKYLSGTILGSSYLFVEVIIWVHIRQMGAGSNCEGSALLHIAHAGDETFRPISE